jgi:glycosyltransferase involved in cell wall biosynthesis
MINTILATYGKKLQIKVDICVALFNEELNIDYLISDFIEHSRSNHYLGNLILVDNGSHDNTWGKLSSYQNSSIIISKLTENVGYGGGTAHAIYQSVNDHIALIPANNKYAFQEVSNLITEYCKFIENDHRTVLFKGLRINRTDPVIVRLLSFLYSTLVSVLAGRLIRDANGAPKIFYKNVIVSKLGKFPKDACFDAALIIELSQSGVWFVEKPVSYLTRRHGRESWDGKKTAIGIKMLLSILKYRFYR